MKTTLPTPLFSSMRSFSAEGETLRAYLDLAVRTNDDEQSIEGDREDSEALSVQEVVHVHVGHLRPDLRKILGSRRWQGSAASRELSSPSVISPCRSETA